VVFRGSFVGVDEEDNIMTFGFECQNEVLEVENGLAVGVDNCIGRELSGMLEKSMLLPIGGALASVVALVAHSVAGDERDF